MKEPEEERRNKSLSHRSCLWYKRAGEDVLCHLCPHSCRISPGGVGRCLVRKNDPYHGFVSLNDGQAAAIAVDPMEKKPLYHFHPGTRILSLGTWGCNMGCFFCQNWPLATGAPSVELVPIEPPDVEQILQRHSLRSVAFTYNEPSVWYEFVLRCARYLKERGYFIVLVTNGMMCPAPLRTLLPYIDAANVDVKAFSEEHYTFLGGNLKTVLSFVETLFSGGVHVELTHLLVPGFNDSEEEFKSLLRWVAGLSPSIPLHVSRSFPQHRWPGPSPSLEQMQSREKLAKSHLFYVYLGNVAARTTTICRHCGHDILTRECYNIKLMELDALGKCRFCGGSNFFRLPGSV